MLCSLFADSGRRFTAALLLVVLGAVSLVLLPTPAEAQVEKTHGWIDVFIPSRGPGAQPTGARLTLFEADEKASPGEQLTSLYAEEGEVTSVPVDPGCYVVSLLNSLPGSVWKKTDTAETDSFACVDAGERVRIDSGDRWPEGIPERHRGVVMTQSDRPVPGVIVDFFRPIEGVTDEQLMELTEADHQAVDYRGALYRGSSVITDNDGYFTQAITFGLCSVIETLTLPDGFVFNNGTRHLRRTSCPGEFASFTVQRQQEALVGGTVRLADGSPVAGVTVDYFVATADGSRGRFLGDAKTDSSGVFSLPVAAGCYVLVHIAPDKELFVGGGRYLEIGVCVEAGEKATDLNSYLSSPKGEASIVGTVRFADGSPVAGLVVDFFLADAVGARGRFIGDETADVDGRYNRVVEPGCYILVFIAPPGARLTHGGRFLEVGICVKEQATATVDAVLTRLAQPCEIQGDIVASPLTGPECHALLAFFESTGGPTWNNSDGWNTQTDPCTWRGLSCAGGRLVEIDLARNGLSGSIPPELGQLANLQSLFLADNRLTGDITAAMTGLRAQATLQALSLSDGPGGNTCFTVTDSTLDPWIAAFDPEWADCEAPADGCNIQNEMVITVLSQRECDALSTFFQATGGPHWIDNRGWNTPTDPCTWTGLTCEDSSLTQLQLFLNNLRGSLPKELAELADLRVLVLNINNLSGPIPPELGQLKNLTNLSLSDNRISGPIPPELGRLRDLRFLFLSDNDLSGSIPAELGQLKQLSTLDIGRNQLTGAIPPELGGLDGVEVMWLSSNQLSAPIPPELGQLSNVRFLDLADNQLAGEIPPELGQLDSLRSLSLQSNRLTGSIPEELGQLRAPDAVNLRDNLLTGDITSAMAAFRNQASLARLRMSDGLGGNDCLTVTDPELVSWISIRDPNWDECDSGPTDPCDQSVASPLANGECDVLVAFYEATKGPGWATITGWNTTTDPCTWFGVTCRDSKLVGLGLVQNNLRGSLPAELANLGDLEVLSLGFNNIGGPIPSELGRLTKLRTLDLGPGDLSGPIPPELGQIATLEVLDVGSSRLSGPIPAELGQLTNLRILHLSGNRPLSGSIPPELGELFNLSSLSLGNTGLSGSIPPELGQLTNLRSLNLAASQLSGSIPPELGRLSNLAHLTMDRNRLSGSVPDELGQVTSLTTIRLNDNLLTGDITVPMSALRANATVRTLILSDGPGGNDCFTLADIDLGTWLSTFDPNWAECD